MSEISHQRPPETNRTDPETNRLDDQTALTTLASLIGRKWHLVVLHRLDDGPKGFSALLSEIDGISNKVLADHLKDLESKRLVERVVRSERPFRVTYSLTDHGESIHSLVVPVLNGSVDVFVEGDR
ncbi:winged helix-turn-helix transcriptional regulator [Halogeometricum limi]|uniref:Transcriptional regulator, HxlR family n=1 Tax=Halogeometricum limi TaxID=555875 RepID=A0A1I6IJD2_9EURY|nr:helix-turn-helix domain-containing protein [Halogeometricum limi]SFR66832.1 transcriptional regulator, HxlR family [Halogeometricum limi]